MTEERKRLLISIGFAWEPSTTWEEMYQRLVAYKKEHKHTIVPSNYKEDPPLAHWVGTQRGVHKKKKMAEERKRLLISIGFVWELSTTWEEMYQQLVAYKKEHTDTNVSYNYKEYPKLGHWVANQRNARINKKMTEERKHLLNSAGFVWNIISSSISLAYLGGYYTGTK